MKIFGKIIEFVTPENLVEGPRVIFEIPFGKTKLPVTITVISTWVIMILLVVLFKWGTKKLLSKPGKKQAFFETLYSFYEGLVSGTLAKWKDKYIAYIGTLLTFIALANIITFFPIPWLYGTEGGFSIAPALRAPTVDMNTTVGLALITTFTFLYAALSTQGVFGYLKGLAEPVAPLFILNVIGELAKPVNISMRLFGNMFAGMVILGLLYRSAPAVIPVPLHLYFDLFSGFVQSYVFTMLTMVYIASSRGDANEEVALA